MGYDTQDQEVIKLLKQLKKADGEYPQDLLVARRQRYQVRMAQIGLGIGTNIGIKDHRTSGPPSAAGTLLETILVVAILAEASAVGYFYRDKVTNFLQKITSPSAVEKVPTLSAPTILEIQGMTPSPFLTSTVISPSLTQSVSSTPVPSFIENNDTAATQANSTPDPNGNNGNHYGQTPKPERTKENNDQPAKDNNNPPPKDNRNEPKPTKSR